MKNKYTACFEKDGDFWIGYVPELPGANTQGETIEEARENLKEAIQLILEVNRKISQKRFKGKSVICENILVPA